jgi:uncharacterized protein YdaU (DUF1376 family)
VSAFPHLPLFTDAWVADTKHLSRLERGTYHDLIVLMWRSPECRVPNDDAWLGKRLGMTANEVVAELRPLIAEFCHVDGNWVTQKRLKKEWDWCSKRASKNSVSAKSRWDNEKDSCERNATDSCERSAPILSYPILKEEKKDSYAVAVATRPKDEVFEEFWKAYPKRDGANPKEPARKLFLAALKAGATSAEITAGARECARRDHEKIGTPYIPQAVKWLRDRRWLDYLAAPAAPDSTGPPGPIGWRPGLRTEAEILEGLNGKITQTARGNHPADPAPGPAGVLPANRKMAAGQSGPGPGNSAPGSA